MFKNFDGANEKLIKEFEEEIKFELPIDYSEFLLKTNGGTFDNFENSFMIESNNEEIQMDSLFGFKDERSLNLINWYKEYKLELPENTCMNLLRVDNLHFNNSVVDHIMEEKQ